MRLVCAQLLSSAALLWFAASCNGHATGGPVGFSGPTLEVTVDGTHLGPGLPDPGSSASLADTRDQFAQITDSQFRVFAGSTQAGATCQLSFEQFGENVAGIHAGGYQLATVAGAGTADGTVTPIGGERVLTPGDSYQCAGSTCDGGSLVISALDSLHVEGYFTGTLSSDSGAAPADVVCSFYVQMGSYAP
ncbi:MAG TPA: hypothetical protein VFF06_09375 [Polyangia bacterium]|nr:hypothetical protein [Polyangia bacterium]